jgi:hypothetical protein
MPRLPPLPANALPCGCTPTHGCTLGDLLHRFGRTRALTRHLEEGVTWLASGVRKKYRLRNTARRTTETRA